ncbi:MAG: AsnC family transcriptional regulator [Hyphomicrobiales bacterium]|nr:MAG: AsnC family transcriptional regulator [Hyphomicrobiales bacterium]
MSGHVFESLDFIDRKILTLLSQNARMTNVNLARSVNLSAPSTAERVKRLEEANVISGYGATITPAAIGLPISVWLRIRPVPGMLQKVVEIIQASPEITQCDRVTGDDCFLACAHLPDVSAMEKLIDRIIPFAMTNTSIIQSSPVSRRLPALPEDKN